MVEVSVSPELSEEPEWLRRLAIAGALSMLGQPEVPTASAVRIESIAWDADRERVSMAVRITPVLTSVKLELRI
jgi:hypothetical protein